MSTLSKVQFQRNDLSFALEAIHKRVSKILNIIMYYK